MRIVNRLKEFATGSFAFVGSARTEMKATDSVTGQILAEAVGQQMGGNAVQTAATWQWGDAERAMELWSKELADRLNQLRTTGTITTASSSS
jgi:predicted carbohydrate-binding protein with CBM5 and CBM33 domain